MKRSLLAGLLALVMMSYLFGRLVDPPVTLDQWRVALVGVPLAVAAAVEVLVRLYRSAARRLRSRGRGVGVDGAEAFPAPPAPSLGPVSWIIYAVALLAIMSWLGPRQMAGAIARKLAAGDEFKALQRPPLPSSLGPANPRDDVVFLANLQAIRAYVERVERFYLGGDGAGPGMIELLVRYGMEGQAWRVAEALRGLGAQCPLPPERPLKAYMMTTFDPDQYAKATALVDDIRQSATRLERGTAGLSFYGWTAPPGLFEGPGAEEHRANLVGLAPAVVEYAHQLTYGAGAYADVRTTVQTQVQALGWFVRDAKASQAFETWYKAISDRVLTVAVGIRDDAWAADLTTVLDELARLAANEVADQKGLELRKGTMDKIKSELAAPLARRIGEIKRETAQKAVEQFLAALEGKLTLALEAPPPVPGVKATDRPIDPALPEGFANWTIGEVKKEASQRMKLDAFSFAAVKVRVNEDGTVSADDSRPTTVKQAVLDVWAVLLEGNGTVKPVLRPRRQTREEAVRSLTAAGYRVGCEYLRQYADAWAARVAAVRANNAPALTVRVLYRADAWYLDDAHFAELKATINRITELHVQHVNMNTFNVDRIDQRPTSDDRAVKDAVDQQLGHVERWVAAYRVAADLITQGKVPGEVAQDPTASGVFAEGSLWFSVFNAGGGSGGWPDPLAFLGAINKALGTLSASEIEKDLKAERPLDPNDPDLKNIKVPEDQDVLRKVIEARSAAPEKLTPTDVSRVLEKFGDPNLAGEVWHKMAEAAAARAAAEDASKVKQNQGLER